MFHSYFYKASTPHNAEMELSWRNVPWPRYGGAWLPSTGSVKMSLIATVWTPPGHEVAEQRRGGGWEGIERAWALSRAAASLLCAATQRPSVPLSSSFLMWQGRLLPFGVSGSVNEYVCKAGGPDGGPRGTLVSKASVTAADTQRQCDSTEHSNGVTRWGFTAWLTGQMGFERARYFSFRGNTTWAGLCRSMPRPQSWGGESHRVKGEGKTDDSSLKTLKLLFDKWDTNFNKRRVMSNTLSPVTGLRN